MTEVNDSSVDQESEIDALLQNTEFGAPLREAREKTGMSTADAAQSLLIPEDIVCAIENSQIEKLPSATFVIGYIRSYARILNISADEVIESYNKILPVDNQIPSIPFVPVDQKNTGNKTLHVMIVSIIGVFVLAWWFHQGTTHDYEQAYIGTDTTDTSNSVIITHE